MFHYILTPYACRRSLTLTLAVVAVLLAQGGAHAQRSRFRFPMTLPPITGTAPTLISCESVLVKANPDNYPHCHCKFGPWSSFRFSSYASSSTCPSGHKYVLDSTRSRLSTKCTLRPTAQRRTKDVCKQYYKHENNNNTKTYNTAVDVNVNLFTIEIEFTVTVIEVIAHVDCSLFFSCAIAYLSGDPTIAEKAQKFIESLGLGSRPGAAVVQSLSLPLLRNNITISRQRRANGVPVTCPASQLQKEVCTDITGKHI